MAVTLMLEASELAWKCEGHLTRLISYNCEEDRSCLDVKDAYKCDAIALERLKSLVSDEYQHYCG